MNERREERCYACGHRVAVEIDEDGNYRLYRPIEGSADIYCRLCKVIGYHHKGPCEFVRAAR